MKLNANNSYSLNTEKLGTQAHKEQKQRVGVKYVLYSCKNQIATTSQVWS